MALACSGPSLFADEPAKPEILPAPKADKVVEIIDPSDPAYYNPYNRISRYEIWQHYGVDRFGRFRPRVVLTPYGAYYSYNGAPYPWLTTHSLEFMPLVVD
jgi:hypothetical protein